jgi:hypothetical protein
MIHATAVSAVDTPHPGLIMPVPTYPQDTDQDTDISDMEDADVPGDLDPDTYDPWDPETDEEDDPTQVDEHGVCIAGIADTNPGPATESCAYVIH